MQHIKDIIKETRSHLLRQVPDTSIKEKASWSTKEARTNFHVEQLKNSIINDFHALQDAIGKQAASAFILEEVDPVKYDSP